MPLSDAEATIRAAYADRGLAIAPSSERHHLITELQRYHQSTRDIPVGTTAAETDMSAVATGNTLLRVVRLADSIALLRNHGVPKITETLRSLGSFDHGNDEQEAQFDEAEYELHMASQFVGHGTRVAFVDTKATSRYSKRVEFMLGYKWPVECKRPRSPTRIMSNLDNAIVKINERAQPGVVCLGLDVALRMDAPFLEAEDVQGVRRQVTEHLRPWLEANKSTLQAKLKGSWVEFVIVTFMVSSYIHESEEVALPSLRLGLSRDGEWIAGDVPGHCMTVMRAARDQSTRGGSS